MASAVLTGTIVPENIPYLWDTFPISPWGFDPSINLLSVYDSTESQGTLTAAIAAISPTAVSLTTVRKEAISALQSSFAQMAATHGWVDTALSIGIPFTEQNVLRMQIASLTTSHVILENTSGTITEYYTGDIAAKATAYLAAYQYKHNTLWAGVNELSVVAADEAAVALAYTTFNNLLWA
jgi:hypothetical protein